MRRYPTASQRNRQIFKRKSYFKKRPQAVIKKGRLIHFFKRTYVLDVAITEAGFVALAQSPAGNTYNNFRLQDLPNYTDFTNLYDTYKICGIKQKFMFNRNSSDSGTRENPSLITVNDFNDTTALASEAEALEYGSFKTNMMDRPIKRYFRSTMLINQNSGTNIQVVKSRWIPTAETDITHHGLKCAVDTVSTSAGAIGTVKIYTTYYIACRTPR